MAPRALLAERIHFPVSGSVFFSGFPTERQSTIHWLLQSINTTFDPSGPFSDQALDRTKQRRIG